MFRFRDFDWDASNEAHIAEHGVTSAEVEEACVNEASVQRGRDGLYYFFGRTDAGRYLFVVARLKAAGRLRPITARDMTSAERKRFRKG